MSELPKCKLCGCASHRMSSNGDIYHKGQGCPLDGVWFSRGQWRTLMAQQQPYQDRLRFQSACEISGEKHPEYVRGYEAAMDAACKQQAEPVAYGIKSNEESGFIVSLGFSKKLAENQCSLLGGHVVPLYTAPQAQPAPTNKEHDNAKDSD